ncbi:tryptophan 7-halogenase [Janthinobacterium sp. DSP2-3-3]|uniref:tryptophan 7-halogenase n=1 Tax=Janthinobacterium sp. DSP2-3-3 TaxID=2804596 RepID=UPI003CE7A833
MPALADRPGAPSPSRQRYRVAIIGGGPAGCACALALALHGVHDVLVIEAGDYAQFCIGESIPPEANRLFQALGIAQEFFAEAHAPCHGSCSWWGSDKRGYNDALMHPLGHGWHLERSRFNRFLARQARLRGTEVLTRASLATSAPTPGGGFALELMLGDPAHPQQATIHADLVVDASGTRAVFARQRGSRKVETLPLVCLAMRFAAPVGARSGLTHLEAVEHGWWYGAHLPDATLLLAFYSDAATVKARRLQQSGHWLAWLAAAPNTAALARGAVPLAGGVQSFPAPSYCLDRLHGDGWLAIGDAASAFDPVTSQGIVKALANGMAAAGAIAGHATLGAVAQSVALRHAQYLAQRRQYYAWEQRWPAAPFWRQLHAGAQAAAS